MKSKINSKDITKCQKIINNLKNNYKKEIIGQDNLFNSILISLISNSHILIESVPGLAKTTAAKTIASAVNASFKRIQCTPDLLPNDIIGTQIFNHSTNKFETKLGPIFSNFVLIDEINRSNSKTQSATLETMQEKQITIDGIKYELPEIFIVIATENPIEQDGTYNLSEAQLDRFLIKEKLDYPTIDEEIKILDTIENNIENSKTSITLDDLKYLQDISNKVYVDDSIKEYIAKIIDATRNPQKYLSTELNEYIEYGSSPRGSISFLKAAKALAIINGRNYVTPDDIKDLKYVILRHRIKLNILSITNDISIETIIDAIFDSISTP